MSSVQLKRFSGLTPPYDDSEASCNSGDDTENADELFSELNDIQPRSVDLKEYLVPKTNVKQVVLKNRSKRKRTVAQNENQPLTKKSKEQANNRNAIMARKNREKKKQFITDLQRCVDIKAKENYELKSQVETLHNTIVELKQEVKFLRSVLHNQSDLSKVLTAVASSPDINLRGSIAQTPTSSDHDYHARHLPLVNPKSQTCVDQSSNEEAGGICVHVSKGNVSFELCCKCNTRHNVSIQDDHKEESQIDI